MSAAAQLSQWRELNRRSGTLQAVRVFTSKLLHRREPIHVRIDGISLRVRLGTPDLGVALSCFGSEFAPLRYLLQRDFNGLIVDAGGYIGTAAIQFARMYPSARIVTVEPATANFDILARNVHRFPNIVPVKAALATTSSPAVPLNRRASGHWGYTLTNTGADGDSAVESTPTVTLGELRRQHEDRPIGILKLDIEGGEQPLLEEAGEELRAVFAVFAELHDRIVPGCTDAFKRFSANRVVSNFGGEKYLSLRDNYGS